MQSRPEKKEMKILLDIKPRKRPGSTGVVGAAYKFSAKYLAPVFGEAFVQLQDVSLQADDVPQHLFETIWAPVAKKAGANTISATRDLEMPNEDMKVLERMTALLVDNCAASDIRIHNQAFFRAAI